MGCIQADFRDDLLASYRHAALQNQKTCFHSFCHCFRDGLRNGRVDREVGMALGGWTSSSNFASVADSYGDGFDMRMLLDEISRVQYPELDLLHLKRVGA